MNLFYSAQAIRHMEIDDKIVKKPHWWSRSQDTLLDSFNLTSAFVRVIAAEVYPGFTTL